MKSKANSKIFIKVIIFILFLPTVGLTLEKNKVVAVTELAIKNINTEVASIESRISKNDTSLPNLKVEYDYVNVTEGIPPNFIFYFEMGKNGSKKRNLRACKVHIGHEVYSHDYIYYFDSNGKSMKYLFIDSGVSGEVNAPSRREGIIYDKSKKIIWKSNSDNLPPLSFEKISKIFSTLDEGLSKF